jgi:hypothetical protein
MNDQPIEGICLSSDGIADTFVCSCIDEGGHDPVAGSHIVMMPRTTFCDEPAGSDEFSVRVLRSVIPSQSAMVSSILSHRCDVAAVGRKRDDTKVRSLETAPMPIFQDRHQRNT